MQFSSAQIHRTFHIIKIIIKTKRKMRKKNSYFAKRETDVTFLFLAVEISKVINSCFFNTFSVAARKKTKNFFF